MKRKCKFIPTALTATMVMAGLAGINANANQFNGAIAFSAAGVTTDNTVLSAAHNFSLTGAFTTEETGEYATLGVTDFTPVNFNGFTFNPPVSSVTPLWVFNLGSTVFSFDATSVDSQWVLGVGGGEWVITGDGIASITGFTDTPGTYTVNLSDSGNMSVGFDATAAVRAPQSVPDGGATMGFLGCSFLLLRTCRKFC